MPVVIGFKPGKFEFSVEGSERTSDCDFSKFGRIERLRLRDLGFDACFILHLLVDGTRVRRSGVKDSWIHGLKNPKNESPDHSATAYIKNMIDELYTIRPKTFVNEFLNHIMGNAIDGDNKE